MPQGHKQPAKSIAKMIAHQTALLTRLLLRVSTCKGIQNREKLIVAETEIKLRPCFSHLMGIINSTRSWLCQVPGFTRCGGPLRTSCVLRVQVRSKREVPADSSLATEKLNSCISKFEQRLRYKRKHEFSTKVTMHKDRSCFYSQPVPTT